MQTWLIPLQLSNQTANRSHWRTRYKLEKSQKKMLIIEFFQKPINTALPCTVKLTRISPRPFDYDNLVNSFKTVRDIVADLLNPGLAPGRADADKRISWEYDQEFGRGKPKVIKIEIYK